MAKWLSKIDPRRKKRSAPSSEPQPYEVMCRCGERTIGIRMPRYQQIICKQCGEALFVLPRNVYPSPPPAKVEPVPADPGTHATGAASLNVPVDDGALIETAELEQSATSTDGLLGELAAESKGLTQKARREQEEIQQRRRLSKLKAEGKEKAKENTSKRQSRRAKKKAELEAAKQEQQANPLLAKVPLKQRIRRQLSPFRLIVAAAILVIAGTTWWQIRSRKIESARLRFDTARKEAMRLIDEGNLAAAEPLLDDAVAAANLIDRQDRISLLIRQLQLETNVVNNLSVGSLGDAIDTATLVRRDEMASVLISEIGDQWILFDTWVTPTNSGTGDIDYDIDVPLLSNEIPVTGRVQTTAFKRLAFTKAGKAVVFAAKLLSAEVRGQAEDAVLTLRFDPNSVRLWGTEKTYKRMGFEDDEVPPHLIEQAQALGIEK
jgi:hypothetical protein